MPISRLTVSYNGGLLSRFLVDNCSLVVINNKQCCGAIRIFLDWLVDKTFRKLLKPSAGLRQKIAVSSL
jgi:hypothetical protein